MRVCGIDPGLHGGIAVIGDGEIVSLSSMPVHQITVGKRKRNEYSVTEMQKIVSDSEPDIVIIEKQQTFPKQGSVSNFTTGFGFGLWIGLCSGLRIPLEVVRPREWKKMWGLSADKARSIATAQRLFPDADLLLPPHYTKPHDGMAEALLIAEYGRRMSSG